MYDLVGVSDICHLHRAFQPVDNCILCPVVTPFCPHWTGIDTSPGMDKLVNRQINAKMLTLVDQCLQLPNRERLNLCAALRDSILQERRDKKPMNQNRAQVLLDMLSEILGEPIPVKSRLTRFVWARAIVAYQLLKEGYSTLESGRMLGKDHSTIIHMRDNMSYVLKFPSMYMDVINIWKQFQNKLQDETNTRTNQNSLPMGGEFQHGSQG